MTKYQKYSNADINKGQNMQQSKERFNQTQSKFLKLQQFQNDSKSGFNSTFTNSLQGFISAEHQSANTLRNSVSPISFSKAERFQQIKTAARNTPFYPAKDPFKDKFCIPHKKGWGFGYSSRPSIQKQAEKKNIPSPLNYHKAEHSQFFSPKQKEKCFFGLSYANLKKCDIDNRSIIEHVSFDVVSPLTYSPDKSKVNKQPQAFSMSGRFPHISEIYRAKEKRPSPHDYKVQDKLVKTTRYSSLHAGGYSPKDYYKADRNPGPGQYENNPTSLGEITKKRSKILSSNFASKTGTQWFSFQQAQTAAVSPRECAFSTPNSGEPFNHFGSFRGFKRPTEKDLQVIWNTNNRTLRSKRHTLNQLEDRISVQDGLEMQMD
eukprot:403339398